MKTQFLVLFLFANINLIYAQDSTNYLAPDTLFFYAFPLESYGDLATAYSIRSSNNTCRIIANSTDSNSPRYYANCNEISKELFDSLNTTKKNIFKCKPCVLNYFDAMGNIIQTSMQYKDCMVGDYHEYYPSGQLKVKGSWKKNYSGKWGRIWKRGYCSVLDGE